MRAVATIALVFAGLGPALATAPCFDVCHLRQGTPLLLPDQRELWMRRCTTAKKSESCVLQRVDFAGTVLETVPDSKLDEDELEDKHLAGKRIVRLEHRSTWKDLTKRHTVPLEQGQLVLRLDKQTLVCERPSGTTVRQLGCGPKSITVRIAGIAQTGKPADPTGLAVIVATCGTASGTADAVIVCP